MCMASLWRQPPKAVSRCLTGKSQVCSKTSLYASKIFAEVCYIPQSSPMTLMTWGVSKKCPNEAIANVEWFNSRLWSQRLKKEAAKITIRTCRVLQVHEAHAYTPVLFKLGFCFSPSLVEPWKFWRCSQSKLVKWRSWSSIPCHQHIYQNPQAIEKWMT